MGVQEFSIFAFCMIGLAYQCWKQGHKAGQQDVLDHLVDIGVLTEEE